MMSVSSQSAPRVSFFDRVFVKLALLFFATLIICMGVFLVWGFFTWSVESKILEAARPAETDTTEIDPKMASDLAKVMTLDELEDEFVPRDPFNDRTGISAITIASATLAAQSKAARANSIQNQALVRSDADKKRLGVGSRLNASSSGPAKAVVLETKDRFTRWLDEKPYGSPGEPPPALFSINDLVPVGVVDGGDGGEEVMFFSEAANRILSFPVGTRFYDGRLMAVSAEGVVFSVGDKIVTTRQKSWGRSVRARGGQTLSINEPVKLNLTNIPEKGKFSVSGGSN